MPEPTIDELIAWVDDPVTTKTFDYDPTWYAAAIIAILEQHQQGVVRFTACSDLEVIRAFVERVEKRIESAHGLNRGVYTARKAIQEELAAMEKETSVGERPRPPKDMDPGVPARG